ncbi:MAG: AMP-binding protein, partial [Psychromonas sp.]
MTIEKNMFRPWIDKYPEGINPYIGESHYSSLVDIFEESFSDYADHSAFVNMDKQMSFKQLDDSSKAIATYLQQTLKLKQGDRVAIMMPNLLQYPIVLLGILRAGMAVVNINPLYTSKELKHQLNDSGAKAIFIVSNFARTLEDVVSTTSVEHVVLTGIGDELALIKRNMVNFVVKYVKKMVPKYKLPDANSYREAIKLGKQGNYIRPIISPDDNAFIQYTGGTTGVSKGAKLTHKNMVSSLMQAEGFFSCIMSNGNETVITALPLYHAFALTVNCLYFIKVGGQNILITNPRDIPAFINTLKKYPFSYFMGLNTLLNALLANEKIGEVDFSFLKVTLAGGMATQQSVAEKWEKLTNTVVLEGYGLTECAPMVCVNPHDTAKFNGSIGIPLPSTDIRLRTDDGEVIESLNCAGEIEIRGPQVMSGYWNNQAETDLVMEDGWFKSGDIGLFDDDANLRIVDRKKDMILVSGFNVYPNEIEAVVSSMEG